MKLFAHLVMVLTLVAAAAPAGTLAQARGAQSAQPTIRVFEGAG